MRSLIERLQANAAPSRELDVLICEAVIPMKGTFPYMPMFGPVQKIPMAWGETGNIIEAGKSYRVEAPRVTSSIDAAVKLCEKSLPGWGWRVATCSVSDDAWVFPDFNSPEHGDRLKRDFSQDIDWADVTDIDLRPPGRQAIALCLAILIALEIAKERNGMAMETTL